MSVMTEGGAKICEMHSQRSQR